MYWEWHLALCLCHHDCSEETTVIHGMSELNLRLRRECEVTGLVSPFEPAPTVLTTSLVDHTYFRLLAIPIDIPRDDLTYGHLRALRKEHVLSLQTFPSDFKLFGHMRFQSTCLGNAVPPLFAYDVGKGLCALLEQCSGSDLLHSALPSDADAFLTVLDREVEANVAP